MKPGWKSISVPGNYRNTLRGRVHRGGAPLLGRHRLGGELLSPWGTGAHVRKLVLACAGSGDCWRPSFHGLWIAYMLEEEGALRSPGDGSLSGFLDAQVLGQWWRLRI